MQSNRYRRYWPQQHPPALIMTQDPVTLARMAQMKTAYSFLSELFKGYVNERSLSIVSTADGSLTLHRRPVPHAYPPCARTLFPAPACHRRSLHRQGLQYIRLGFRLRAA